MTGRRSLLNNRMRFAVLTLLAAVWFSVGIPALRAQPAAQNLNISYDDGSGNAVSSNRSGAAAADGGIAPPPAKTNAEILQELEQMRVRIQELEAQLKAQQGASGAPGGVAGAQSSQSAAPDASLSQFTLPAASAQTQAVPAKPQPAEPFAYADWTWLNGNARTKNPVWDSKFFTPEIRFDANFISSLNHPRDDTMAGSTEIFRSNEVQIEQISLGGDFHWDNVRARFLTMAGMFGVTTPRNDSSPGRGQWDLRGAYKYFSEAYGGYHWNVNHGLNLDAGIFVSYIGLFSYYNFDNWAYQPSYVSSNTPWFFNGVRIQWFPTDKLKIEPWLVNGWQSYGRLGATRHYKSFEKNGEASTG